MDKSKKASSKKNKTTGSAAKGHDVTDSSNARDKTAAAAATSSSVESSVSQKLDSELQQLRQENQKLVELKRRHEAEISAVSRSNASTKELINSLMGVNHDSGDTTEVSLEQILNNCTRQREEMLEIKRLSERQSIMLKNLRETVTSGGCARCTFRRCYEDLDVPLMTAVQCTEPPSTGQNHRRQVLLNDGRQFMLTTASVNDSDVSTFHTSPTVGAASHTPANSGSIAADDANLPNDLSLRDEAQAATAAAAIATDSAVPPCPVCQLSGFSTAMELNLHVNTHLDVEDVVD